MTVYQVYRAHDAHPWHQTNEREDDELREVFVTMRGFHRTHSDTLVTLHGNVCLGCSMLPAACMVPGGAVGAPLVYKAVRHLSLAPVIWTQDLWDVSVGITNLIWGGVIIRSPSPTNIAGHGLVGATARLHGRDGESRAVGPQPATSLGHT